MDFSSYGKTTRHNSDSISDPYDRVELLRMRTGPSAMRFKLNVLYLPHKVCKIAGEKFHEPGFLSPNKELTLPVPCSGHAPVCPLYESTMGTEFGKMRYLNSDVKA